MNIKNLEFSVDSNNMVVFKGYSGVKVLRVFPRNIYLFTKDIPKGYEQIIDFKCGVWLTGIALLNNKKLLLQFKAKKYDTYYQRIIDCPSELLSALNQK